VGAISVLDRANAIIGVVAGYILLLVVNTVVLESRSSLQDSAQGTNQSSIWYAAMILFVVGYIIVYLQQLRTHSQLQVTHARLKASAAKIEELTLANERQRIARDLHDTLAQGLAGVAMQLEAANTHLSHHHAATAQEIVQQAILCAREALIDARGAIDDLRAKQTSTSEISVALQKEVDRFVMAAGIPCIADISQSLSVSPILSEHVLGILREGLTNVTRHAQAHQVRVSFGPRGDTLTLEIDDDGVGFDPVAATQSGHYGLIGVRERARLLGGYLTIRSAPGIGTSLHLRLPGKQEAWGMPEPDPARHEKETEREDLHV
jgi:NarL family two-component system sensor histidine kinase YdfH